VSDIEVMNRSQIALPTRISCGLATFHGYETPRQLIGEAEDQMYLDKTVAPVVKTYETSLSSPGLVKLSTLKALRNLVRAIDRRDSYTRYHSDHATQAALRFMNHIRLPQDQVAAVSIGGPIHDLGKIVVPDEILRKPGPLTASERRTMEEHPVIGAAMAAAVTDFEIVVDMVRHHHERFDGNGYPGGLRGQEISYSTRIFSVADAFSAMTTDRPYRRTMTLDQAVAEIRAGAGTQFDPDIAPEFANLMEKHLAGKPKRQEAA
jgi:HD-GYP domain-containing protein (c-di-GMP phosphodiesterase class II)